MKILFSIVSAFLLAAGDSAPASLDAADTANSVESDGGSGTRLEEEMLWFLNDGTNRIVGGNPVDKTRYPYFTALFYSTDIMDETTFLCGGSLIREDVVMTAGHCIIQNSRYTVRQVFVNFTSFDDLRYGQARNVSSIFRHPDYYVDEGNNNDNSVNDIALLFLESPVSRVTTLALNGNASIPIDNEIITAIGIGYTQEDGSLQSVLMEVDLPKVNDALCVAQYQGFYVVDPTVMVCAGYENGGNDTCSGDSGGPYIIVGATPMDDIIVGITSFGEGCARPGFPGVTTRVSAFKDWVMCVLEGDCTQSPTGAPTPYPTPPPPIDLPGPMATINVTWTTDAYTNLTKIYYFDNCTSNAVDVVDGFDDNLSAFTTYSYTFTLPVGQYVFLTIDSHAAYDFDFLGSIVFSFGNVTLHEISNNQVFYSDTFQIVIGDEQICNESPTQGPTPPPPPHYLPGPVATINVTLTTDAYTNLTEIYYEYNCTLEYVKVVNGFYDNLEAFTTYYYTLTLPVGQYKISTRGSHYFNNLDFLGSFVFSSGNVTLHEISANQEFYDDTFQLVIGDPEICTPSPTQSPTPPPPTYLPGPMATINVTWTTDAHIGITEIDYRNNCTFDTVDVVDGLATFLPFTTYHISFTLPVGMYEFTINDYHSAIELNFLGSIVFSSGNVTLHEISTNQVFSEEIFHIVIGDGGICTPSPTLSPTAPPPPIYLPGPMATINIAWTTDAHTNLTEIYYFDNCTFEQVDVVDRSDETLEAFTTYYYTFTLPVGQYGITTRDYYFSFYGLDFLDRIVFSSSNETLHEISGNVEFFEDYFQVVVGDGEMCTIPDALPTYPTISPAPSVILSPQTPSDLTDATCDDIQDVKFPVLLDGILTQKTCDWLAGNHREAYREALCIIGNVAYDICAETCKKCSDTCVDEEGDFPSLYFRSRMVSCEDLAKHGERWRGKYCDEGLSPMAEMLCKETCNTCD